MLDPRKVILRWRFEKKMGKCLQPQTLVHYYAVGCLVQPTHPLLIPCRHNDRIWQNQLIQITLVILVIAMKVEVITCGTRSSRRLWMDSFLGTSVNNKWPHFEVQCRLENQSKIRDKVLLTSDHWRQEFVPISIFSVRVALAHPAHQRPQQLLLEEIFSGLPQSGSLDSFSEHRQLFFL